MRAIGRRHVLTALGASLVVPTLAAVALPTALDQPAEQTPRALRAGMLAIARAGQRVVAAGERGTVLLSDDGGRQWRQATVPVQVTLTSLRFFDAQQGWATGHMGVVLRTGDGGQTWQRQLDGSRVAERVLEEAQTSGDEAAVGRAQRFVQEGPDKPLFDIVFLDARRAIAVGAYDLVLATDDAGARWRSASTRLDKRRGLHLYAVRQLGAHLFIAGEQGLLMRSSDGGQHFETLASPAKGSFFGLLETPQGSLLAYGLRGQLCRSTDRGDTWVRVDSGTRVGLGAGLVRGDGSVLLLSQNGDVLVSRDDGAHFSPLVSQPTPVADMLLASDSQLILAGLRGLQPLSLPS